VPWARRSSLKRATASSKDGAAGLSHTNSPVHGLLVHSRSVSPAGGPSLRALATVQAWRSAGNRAAASSAWRRKIS
jgi:hypothetical protein